MFAPGCCLGEIEERLGEMEKLARARLDALHRSTDPDDVASAAA